MAGFSAAVPPMFWVTVMVILIFAMPVLMWLKLVGTVCIRH